MYDMFIGNISNAVDNVSKVDELKLQAVLTPAHAKKQEKLEKPVKVTQIINGDDITTDNLICSGRMQVLASASEKQKEISETENHMNISTIIMKRRHIVQILEEL